MLAGCYSLGGPFLTPSSEIPVMTSAKGCVWTVWKASTLCSQLSGCHLFPIKCRCTAPCFFCHGTQWRPLEYRAAWALCSQTRHVKSLEISILWLQHREEFSSKEYWQLLDMWKQNDNNSNERNPGVSEQTTPALGAQPRYTQLGSG